MVVVDIVRSEQVLDVFGREPIGLRDLLEMEEGLRSEGQ